MATDNKGYGVSLGLPSVPPILNDDNLYYQFNLLYQAINNLANSTSQLVSTAVNKSIIMTASEAIPAGVFVNFYRGQVRIADADNTTGTTVIGLFLGNMAPCAMGVNDRPVMGFTVNAIQQGASGVILVPPTTINFGSNALTTGTNYYLEAAGYTPSTALGKMYAGPPAGSGNGYIRQYIGIAISNSEFYFNPDLDPYYW